MDIEAAKAQIIRLVESDIENAHLAHNLSKSVDLEKWFVCEVLLKNPLVKNGWSLRLDRYKMFGSEGLANMDFMWGKKFGGEYILEANAYDEIYQNAHCMGAVCDLVSILIACVEPYETYRAFIELLASEYLCKTPFFWPDIPQVVVSKFEGWIKSHWEVELVEKIKNTPDTLDLAFVKTK